MDFQDTMEGGTIQECCRNLTLSSGGGAVMILKEVIPMRIVGTMMNTFTKSTSISRDEASYKLGGGLYKQMSMPVKKCSVSRVHLDDINENVRNKNGDVNSSKSKEHRLIWSDVVKQYKKHNSNDEDMNVYKFIVKCMFPKEFFAPQFIGFDQVGTNPLKEEYSK
eukprot:15347763-Ditylum_brightwellii.AAC.1